MKLMFHWTTVVPALLNASEIWTTYSGHQKTLENSINNVSAKSCNFTGRISETTMVSSPRPTTQATLHLVGYMVRVIMIACPTPVSRTDTSSRCKETTRQTVDKIHEYVVQSVTVQSKMQRDDQVDRQWTRFANMLNAVLD